MYIKTNVPFHNSLVLPLIPRFSSMKMNVNQKSVNKAYFKESPDSISRVGDGLNMTNGSFCWQCN